MQQFFCLIAVKLVPGHNLNLFVKTALAYHVEAQWCYLTLVACELLPTQHHTRAVSRLLPEADCRDVCGCQGEQHCGNRLSAVCTESLKTKFTETDVCKQTLWNLVTSLPLMVELHLSSFINSDVENFTKTVLFWAYNRSVHMKQYEEVFQCRQLEPLIPTTNIQTIYHKMFTSLKI